MLMGKQGGPFKAHIKTGGATDSPFRFPLHALNPFKPVAHIIIPIVVLQPQFFAKPLILHLAQFIFLFWMNIGIIKKDSWSDPRVQQCFKHFTFTGSTARVEKYFRYAFGWSKVGSFSSIHSLFIKIKTSAANCIS